MMGLLSRQFINTDKAGRPSPGQFPHDNSTPEPKCWGKGCMCCSGGSAKSKQ